MEERPGRIVLDENTGMLLWQYEDDGSYVPLEVYNDRIFAGKVDSSLRPSKVSMIRG